MKLAKELFDIGSDLLTDTSGGYKTPKVKDRWIKSDEEAKPKKHGIRYIGGKRFVMSGESTTVDIPDDAKIIKIYAETGDIRVQINDKATADSPIVVFMGVGPEVLELTNLNTLAIIGAFGTVATVTFYGRD